ncbi:MAG: hypothetical protein ABI769_10825 [Pseudomonadota bacterium]
MTARHFILFVVLALSAWGTPHVARAAESAPAAKKRGVLATIESARKALQAGRFQEGADAIGEVMQMPELAEAASSLQFQVLVLGAAADLGREDSLGAHEYMAMATEFPQATAIHWLMRAQYAAWVDDWADAAIATTAVAKRWPKAIATGDSQLISRVGFRANDDGKHRSEQLELLNALFAANFTLQLGLQPDGLWQELIVDALDRNDLPRAREISKRVQNTETLVQMRIDRRFDVLVRAEPKVFDITAALNYQRKLLAKAVSADPRSMTARVQYGYTLQEAGRFEELLALTNEVIARVAAAPADSPPYDDGADKLNWIYNHKASSLRAMGHWEDALTVLEAGNHQQENGAINVSQRINLGAAYLEIGRAQKALEALDGIDWAHSLSPYGRMQLQHVRYCAYLQLGNTREADNVLAYLREHHDDAESTWQEAMIDAGDLDGAAALLIARLHDPDQRSAALGEVQDYKPLPHAPKRPQTEARWDALIARPDVAAAINAVGRREKIPLYAVHN